MKTSLLFIFIFIFCQSIHSQKLVKKIIANSNKQYVKIDSKNCFQVNIKTSSSKELQVKASIEGEYLKNLVVKIEENGSDVIVSTGFLPNFKSPNDKLSAHKVISIALDITIPEYSHVQLYGTNSNILAKGKYKFLSVSLSDGNCILNNVSENVEVKTQSGNIVVFAQSGLFNSKSIYGKVNDNNLPKGNSKYLLNSIEGDIQISKTE